MNSVLETTLGTRYVPGTNLKQQSPRAGWLYLLPSLDLTGVLCIGVPGRGMLAVLARRARKLAVVCLTRHDFRQRDRLRGMPGLEEVEWLDGKNGRLAPEAVDWAALVVLAGRRGRRWLAQDGDRGTIFHRILDRGGQVYLEYGGWGTATPNGRGGWAGLRRFGEARFRLLPLRGEARVAVPEGDGETLDHFVRSGLVHPWLWSGLPGRVRRLLRRLLGPRAFGRRHGVLLGGPASRPVGRPPEYLCAIARRQGVPLDEYRWGLSLPDAYRSRKLLFYLYGTRPTQPSYVAKMVSDPSLNGRLENEARALRQLKVLGMADGERIPGVAFSGEHAGLALVGETLVQGVPFRQKSQGGPSCPHAEAALEGILDLGRLTRQPGAATGSHVASALGRLLGLFDEIYRDGEVGAFLHGQVESLGRHAGSLPLVFQHGDPGSWNLLVTLAGHVAFLDWEAAEPAGLPLWDLLYFLRSYGVLSARRRGVRVALRAFELAFLVDSDLARWMRQAVTRYCEEIGVAGSLVEPLFYTCWMHRSIKESTRLEPRDLGQGHYLNLLRLGIREREALGRLIFPSG